MSVVNIIGLHFLLQLKESKIVALVFLGDLLVSAGRGLDSLLVEVEELDEGVVVLLC